MRIRPTKAVVMMKEDVPGRTTRDTWDLHPTKLPDVCQHLGLELQHHNAASDAEACANIVLAARSARGVRVPARRSPPRVRPIMYSFGSRPTPRSPTLTAAQLRQLRALKVKHPELRGKNIAARFGLTATDSRRTPGDKLIVYSFGSRLKPVSRKAHGGSGSKGSKKNLLN